MTVLFFCENEKNTDIITYNDLNHFLLFNIDVLQINENGNYFYEYTPKRDGDNIRYESDLNEQLTYYFNGIKYIPEDVSEFIFCSAPYTEFKIRITFLEKPNTNDEFKINARHWIINSNDRKTIISKPVIVKNIIYKDGVYVQKLIKF